MDAHPEERGGGMNLWTTDKNKLKKTEKGFQQIQCLVMRKGLIKLLFWNCDHECWDNSEGDDYECDFEAVQAFIPVSELGDRNVSS